MDPQEAYDELAQRSREIFTVGSISALALWDQQVNMPRKGIRQRAAALSYLAQLSHQKQTDPRFGELLDAADAGQWEAQPAANLREWRRDYELATKLPEALVTRKAEVTAKATQVWEQARAASDFGAFAPLLKEQIALSREEADHLGYAGERYDALLDLYEPGMTTTQVEALFGGLRSAVVPLLQRIVGSARQPKDHLFGDTTFPQARQCELGIEITKALGFDYEAGRLDVSAHPFTQGMFAGDVRLTTRYDEHWPFQALMGTIHESGHGMYDQGLPVERTGEPLGDAVSMGIHESQSRFWENNVGRSRAFWQCWLPRFEETFGLSGLDFEDFYLLINRVQPSLIRVEADEVTYSLHIMARYEIERDLFRDQLRVEDLPAAWNAKYQEYLGIGVPDDRRGVLQDVHWSWGNFGYFPTYALGSVYAAQIEAALRSDVPDLDSQMAAGQYGAALSWLREHIHRLGKLYRPAQLIKHATGKAPAVDDYVAYLTHKYGELYL